MGASSARSKLNTLGDDLGAILLFAVLPFPAPVLDTTFDKDRASLLEVLCDRIRLAAKDDDVVKIGLLLLLAVAISIDAVGSQAKATHIHAAWHSAKLRITCEVAKQECLIDVHTVSVRLKDKKTKVTRL